MELMELAILIHPSQSDQLTLDCSLHLCNPHFFPLTHFTNGLCPSLVISEDFLSLSWYLSLQHSLFQQPHCGLLADNMRNICEHSPTVFEKHDNAVIKFEHYWQFWKMRRSVLCFKWSAHLTKSVHRFLRARFSRGKINITSLRMPHISPIISHPMHYNWPPGIVFVVVKKHQAFPSTLKLTGITEQFWHGSVKFWFHHWLRLDVPKLETASASFPPMKMSYFWLPRKSANTRSYLCRRGG